MRCAFMMKALPLLLLLPLASCGFASGEERPRTERAQTRLTRALEGKVAGEPQRCLPPYGRNELEVIDRNTLLYKSGRNLVYRNDPEGGCGGLDQTRTIVTTSHNGQTCRGDIIRIVDQVSGSFVGSCAFSDFIPYRLPGTGPRTGSSR